MKKFLFFLLCCSQLVSAEAPFWSKTGHRAIGEVAQDHLNRRARKAIAKLLDGQSLANVANFADEIKADRNYREFSAWHYVNFPKDKKYTDVPPSEYGDLVVGIQKCIAILQNTNSSEKDRSFYLKMLVHLIGDLHQPMHVGRLEDKGGNDIQLQWFGKGTNLHRVWDADMINDHGMSYSELASALPKWDKKTKKAVQKGTVLDWIEETQDITNRVYESADVGEKLGYRYAYDWWGTVEQQLQRGGLRLAKILNDIF